MTATMNGSMARAIVVAGLLAALAPLGRAAERHWVGPTTGDWWDTANWSATAGGAGGASVPGSGDNAYINGGRTANLNSGTVTVVHLHTGSGGDTGTLNLGGTADLRISSSWDNQMGTGGGTAYVNQTGSSVLRTNQAFYFGSNYNSPGHGTYVMDSPDAVLNIAQQFHLTRTVSCDATVDIRSGTVYFAGHLHLAPANSGGGVMSTVIELGKTGAATLIDTGAAQDLVLRPIWYSNRSARLEGVGALQMTGSIENNHKVIANGWGTERTLDMSSFNGTYVTPYLDNYNLPAGDGSGWWAVGKGELLLPAISVSASASPASYYWGQGATYNRVNSFILDLDSVATAGDLSVSLLAADRSELGTTLADTAAAGGLLSAVWDFNPDPALDFDTAALTFRYDNYSMTAGEEAQLGLYKEAGNSWVDVSTLPGVNVVLNTAANTIQASGLDSFSFYALGIDVQGMLGPIVTAVPEPATFVLGLLLAAAVYARRSRTYG